MNFAPHQIEGGAGHAAWENEGGAIASTTKPAKAGAAQLPLRTNSKPLPLRVKSDAAAKIASLNSDGARNWFIPPYVIPSAIAVLVVAYAIYRN